MSEQSRLDFANLPLIEVAIRATLEKPLEVRFSTVNKMSERLRDQFPLLSEPTQVDVPPGLSGHLTFGPDRIPGAVFEGPEQGLAISLFSQLLVARWQRPPSALFLPAYPRFHAIRDALWRAFDALANACNGEGAPQVVVVNMSYVNFIQIAHVEPVLGRYFSKDAHVGLVKNAERVHKVEVSWHEREGFDLRYCLEGVSVPIEDQMIEGYRFTTVGGAHVPSSTDAADQLEAVHDRLQAFFLSLISDHAKSVWGLEGI